MISRTQKRVAQVKAKVSMPQLLSDLGYAVRASITNREQQFACDLHGDGKDNKPSARCYPDSNTFYCFACSKVRDVVEVVKEKKGLDFMEALSYLEKTYNLPIVPWEQGEEQSEKLSDIIAEQLDPNRTFERDVLVFKSIMFTVTKEHQLSMRETLGFWEAFDKVSYLVAEKKITEKQGRVAVQVLRDKLKKVTS
jgi:DNA primase